MRGHIVLGIPGPAAQAEANARLIASAPALQAHADAMAEALAFAPIPGRGEEMMAFRDRQDKWLATKFTALAAYQATKP